jgi:hypothetical protein
VVRLSAGGTRGAHGGASVEVSLRHVCLHPRMCLREKTILACWVGKGIRAMKSDTSFES